MTTSINFTVFVICLGALVTIAHSDTNRDLTEKYGAACLAEKNITEEQIQNAMKNDDPVMGCFLACVFEKMGILKDAAIDKTKIIEYFKNFAIQGKQKDMDETEISEKLGTCVDE
ncbi:hypothetical protein QAD02_000861, partial [Eretmocerus hayati]